MEEELNNKDNLKVDEQNINELNSQNVPNENKNVLENNLMKKDQKEKNVQNLKKNKALNLPKKPEDSTKTNFEVKIQFQKALNKITNSETKNIGIEQIKKLLEAFNTENYFLTYFSILKELTRSNYPNFQKDNIKAIEIKIIGLLSKYYQNSDKIIKIIDLLHNYLQEENIEIQENLSRTYAKIFNNSHKNMSIEEQLHIFVEPLLLILMKGNYAYLNSVNLILFDLFIFSKENNLLKLFEISGEKFITLFENINYKFIWNCANFFIVLIILLENYETITIYFKDFILSKFEMITNRLVKCLDNKNKVSYNEHMVVLLYFILFFFKNVYKIQQYLLIG